MLPQLCCCDGRNPRGEKDKRDKGHIIDERGKSPKEKIKDDANSGSGRAGKMRNTSGAKPGRQKKDETTQDFPSLTRNGNRLKGSLWGWLKFQAAGATVSDTVNLQTAAPNRSNATEPTN